MGYSFKKICYLKRIETKREQGLLRDCEGIVIVSRGIGSRHDLIRRMYASGYQNDYVLKKDRT